MKHFPILKVKEAELSLNCEKKEWIGLSAGGKFSDSNIRKFCRREAHMVVLVQFNNNAIYSNTLHVPVI